MLVCKLFVLFFCLVLVNSYYITGDAEDQLCGGYFNLQKVYYLRGIYQCRSGRLQLETCLNGDKDVGTRGLTHCGSSIPEDEETLKKSTQKFCEMYRSQKNFGLIYAIYQDYKVLYCSKSIEFGNYHYYFRGCLFGGRYALREFIKTVNDKEGDQIDSFHKDYCFKLGEKNNYIDSRIKARWIENCAAGRQKNCIQPWFDRTVYYQIAKTACSTFKQDVERVIREFEAKTCLKFVKSNENGHIWRIHPNYVEIFESDWRHHLKPTSKLCKTKIGLHGGKQVLKASFYCLFQKFHQLVGLKPDKGIYTSYAKMMQPSSFKITNADARSINALYKC